MRSSPGASPCRWRFRAVTTWSDYWSLCFKTICRFLNLFDFLGFPYPPYRATNRQSRNLAYPSEGTKCSPNRTWCPEATRARTPATGSTVWKPFELSESPANDLENCPRHICPWSEGSIIHERQCCFSRMCAGIAQLLRYSARRPRSARSSDILG
jgi:hypothetical protein